MCWCVLLDGCFLTLFWLVCLVCLIWTSLFPGRFGCFLLWFVLFVILVFVDSSWFVGFEWFGMVFDFLVLDVCAFV